MLSKSRDAASAKALFGSLCGLSIPVPQSNGWVDPCIKGLWRLVCVQQGYSFLQRDGQFTKTLKLPEAIYTCFPVQRPARQGAKASDFRSQESLGAKALASLGCTCRSMSASVLNDDAALILLPFLMSFCQAAFSSSFFYRSCEVV